MLIRWKSGGDLRIDGWIHVKGENGQAGNGGGGSGGALLLEAYNFTGFGFIDLRGGDGSGSGGGGGGGRLSVLIEFKNSWNGYMWAYGGHGGGDTPGGAAGTVYIEESDRGPQYSQIKYNPDGTTEKVSQSKTLIIDNNNLDIHLYADHAEPWLYTDVYEGDHVNYTFDVAILNGHANMKIGYPDHTHEVSVWIHWFEGDRTGMVHLREEQKLYVEYIEYMSNETVAPTSFRIDNGSELFLPSTTNLLGTRTYIGGRITGVEHLLITGGADVLVMSTAQTALIEDDAYVMVTKPGNFTLSQLTVERVSALEFDHLEDLFITCGILRVKYEGEMFMDEAEIYSTTVIIESGGVLHLDGTGFQAGNGTGAGKELGGSGTGAGHGGQGGGNCGGSGDGYGGVSYDSIYFPKEHGSGGGNSGSSAGGAGGGLLEMYVAELAEFDGTLGLKGKDATGGNSMNVIIP